MFSTQDAGLDSEAYRELSEKEEKLQKQIIQLSEENIELKFEVEQSRKDIPRLKVSAALTTNVSNVPHKKMMWFNQNSQTQYLQQYGDVSLFFTQDRGHVISVRAF